MNDLPNNNDKQTLHDGEGENLFQMLFERSADAYLILDGNLFVDCNQATVNMLGASTKEEVLSTHPSQLSPEFQPDGRHSGEKADEMIKLALEKGSNRFEWTHRRVNGDDFPVEVLLTPIPVGDRYIIHTVWRDISELKVALRAERDFNAALVEASPAFLVTIGADGRIRTMNQAMLQALGYTFDEVGGKDYLTTVVSETERPMLTGFFTHLTDLKESTLNENHVLAKDGRLVLVEWHGRPMFKTSGEFDYYFGFGLDINERKQAEARLRTMVENAPEAIVVVDLTTGLFTEPNENAVKLYGLLREELVKVGPADMSPPVQPDGRLSTEKAMEQINAAMQGETPIFEWTHRNARGEDIPCEIRLVRVPGNLPLVRASVTDITERKRAEDVLRKANARVQAVLDAMTQEAIIATEPDGMLTVFNTGAERMLGYSAEEMVGKQTPAILHIESEVVARGKELSAEFGRPIEGFDVFVEYARQGRYEERNWTYVRKHGAHLTVSLAVTALHDSEGNIIGFLGVARDITERIRLEQQIQTAFERRGHEVQISTEIAQEVASASELSDLFGRVVTLTKERLGYYHTQLLRYDATQDAVVLINGYGETGQKMLARGHKMPMGRGLIGTAAASGQTILRPALAEDPDWQPNPLLPDTQGEIAVPIKLGEQVLGVLDVQSDQAGALSEDDRLLLEGLCGQIAVAIEGTRLRQEMAEHLEEVNRLYRSMSHEGWKTYRDTADLPAGFMFDQAGIQPVNEDVLADELFANVPLKVPGGEVVGMLTVANDPRHPTSAEDHAFLQQVSDQIALALESARLFEQTQSALAQTERLSEASLRFARSADLQELLVEANKMLGIPRVNRALLGVFNYDSSNELDSMDIVANWWSGSGHEPSEIGRHYTEKTLNILPMFVSLTPVFFSDTFHDERINASTMEIFKRQNILSMAVLPLHLGSRQTGILFLESEEPYNFTQNEILLFSAMAPQIATVLENRRQFERAQKQAERETTLNIISQKIQGATTVEAVLQIAARELGHALGAPRTIAQLSIKDKK
jgi:PAS domain S-box-containing protein